MKQSLLYCLLCAAFSTFSQSPFSRARHNIEQNNFKPAFAILDSCQSRGYFKDSVLYYKGLANTSSGNIKEAKKNGRALCRNYPAFTEQHYLNGVILFNKEEYARSVDEFALAIKNNPNHFKAIYNRSLALGMLENYLPAIEDLTACSKLEPNNPMVYYSRAYWYEFLDKFDDAGKDYEKALSLDPKNYDAYFGLAYAYQNQKDSAKACDAINRAIDAGSQIAEELKSTFCR